MRVACVQLAGQDLPDPTARRSAARDATRELTGSDLIVLPELWPVGFFDFAGYQAAAEPVDGPSTQFAVGLAREHGAWVHGGSFVERAEGALHNTSMLVDRDGSLAATYRKRHLFGYQSAESELLSPGSAAAVADLDGLRVGLATCYDLRFPELFRDMVDAGAGAFVVTSAWPASRIEHWRVLCRARALENLAWLVACNSCGTDQGVVLGGHSVIVDPLGEVVAEAGAEPTVLVADIWPERVREVRAEFPFLADR